MKGHSWSRLVIYARIAAIATAFAVLAPATTEAAIAVTLTWDRNPDGTTAGYYVYCGTESHQYTTSINVGNTTTAVIYLPDPRDLTVTYYFAVQAYSATGERSPLSPETAWPAAQAPTLTNPGNQTGVMGVSITLQLSATDPRGLTLTYSAGGLPPGLLISSSTGRISGTPSTAGTYDVTLAASNTNGVSSTRLITWAIVGPTGGGGGGTGGGGGIGTPTPVTPPPSSGGSPGGGIGTPPPSSGGNPGGGSGTGGGSGIVTPPSSGGTPGGVGIGTPPPFSGGNPVGGGPGNGSGDGGSTDPVAPIQDLTPPTVRITSPPTDGAYRTMNSKIIVTGTASDNVGVVSVMWANSRGGAGTSLLGTSSWATSPIDLKMGENILTITVSDAAGNVKTVTFTVTRIVDLENRIN